MEAGVQRLAVALAWRPEWPALVVAALAWVALIVLTQAPARHDGHVGLETFVVSLGPWTLMCVAMMSPATLPAVRHVGLNSIRRRRRWAMALYLCAYVTPWVGFGAVALALVSAATAAGAERAHLVLGVLAVATCWQATRWKRRALIACRRTVPLPPVGWRADAGCVRFGLSQSSRCLVSSWPLMVLMALIGHGNVLATATLTGFVVVEERGLVRDRLARQITFSLVVASLGMALLLGSR